MKVNVSGSYSQWAQVISGSDQVISDHLCLILFYFILTQSGKILAQFLCKSFILLYILFILFCFIANGRTALPELNAYMV